MSGHTLFRYFFRRQLVTTMQMFFGILTIAFIAQFTEFSRQAGSAPDYTILGGLYLSLLRVPSLILMVVPFVILFGSMTTLMSLNRRLELVVARSAGVSAWQFLAPLCAASFLVGAFAVLVVNPISAPRSGVPRNCRRRFAGIKKADGPASQIPWFQQRTGDGVTVIGAAATARRGLLLARPVFLRISPEGSIKERIDATQALLQNGSWNLTDATIIGPNRNRTKLKHYEIESGLSPEMVEQRLANPESIPFYELGSKVRLARAMGMKGDNFAMQYHSLIALPPLLVAMTLIAATVSMRFARMGQSATLIVGGIVAGFLLYVVTVSVTAFGSAGLVPPVVAAWLPVAVAMFIGVAFLLFKEDG